MNGRIHCLQSNPQALLNGHLPPEVSATRSHRQHSSAFVSHQPTAHVSVVGLFCRRNWQTWNLHLNCRRSSKPSLDVSTHVIFPQRLLRNRYTPIAMQATVQTVILSGKHLNTFCPGYPQKYSKRNLSLSLERAAPLPSAQQEIFKFTACHSGNNCLPKLRMGQYWRVKCVQ